MQRASLVRVVLLILFGLPFGSLLGCGGTSDNQSTEHDTGPDSHPAGGFVADQCVLADTLCTPKTSCPAGYGCNYGIETGQPSRGLCQKLGCASEGSVCSDSSFCEGSLVCNFYYSIEVTPSEDNPQVSEDGVPLKAQCRPAVEGQPCYDDDDCDDRNTGLSCNEYFAPRQCRYNREGDLCMSDNDCNNEGRDWHYLLHCRRIGYPCFSSQEVACFDDFDDWSLVGQCEEPLAPGEACTDVADCATPESDELWRGCVRVDNPEFTHELPGRCINSDGLTTGVRCDYYGDCEQSETCRVDVGECRFLSREPGEPCSNSSGCYSMYTCLNGVCTPNTED